MVRQFLTQYKHLIKEGGWVFTGQISVAIISLVGLRILTEIAPANILGGATLLLGILTLLRNIFIAPIGNTQIRFHPEYVNTGNAKWFDDNIRKLYLKLLVVSIIVFILIYFIWVYYSSFSINLLLLLILILYYSFDAIKGYKINRLSAERRQKYAALWQIADVLLINTFFIVFLIYYTNVESYLAGQGFGLLVGLIFFGFIFFPKIKNKETAIPDVSEIKTKVIKYGLPFVPLAIVSWISNLGDRYIISNYLTLNEVGIYTATYSIASRPILMFYGIMSGLLRPILFQAEGIGNTNKAKIIFKHWITVLILSAIIIFICYLFLGKIIINLLLAANYRENNFPIFMIIAASYLIYGIVQTFESRLYSVELTKNTILPSSLAAGFNIIMNYLMIPCLGIMGAAFASLISFSVHLFIVLMVYYSKVSKSEKNS